MKELLARRPTAGALLYLDLDRFKPVNDVFGHHAGDLVLVEVARRLQATVRAGATVARIGRRVRRRPPGVRHPPARRGTHRERGRGTDPPRRPRGVRRREHWDRDVPGARLGPRWAARGRRCRPLPGQAGGSRPHRPGPARRAGARRTSRPGAGGRFPSRARRRDLRLSLSARAPPGPFSRRSPGCASPGSRHASPGPATSASASGPTG